MPPQQKHNDIRTQIFSTKAEKYARFRWDYALQAIAAIFDITDLSASAIVADIGAGTGILTWHFLELVNQIYAVEPNREMRQLLITKLAGNPHCQVMDGIAEKTGIPTGIVDLITAGTAIHWFDPIPARKEFIRIIKPGGWLAILSNQNNDQALNQAMEAALDPAWHVSDIDTSNLFPDKQPRSFYFGGSQFLQQSYPFTLYETWDQFFGAWSTLSYAPDEDDPHFTDFENAARDVFDRFAGEDGLIPIHGLTRLDIGQIRI